MLFLSSIMSMHVFPLTVNTITGERSLDIFTRRRGREGEARSYAMPRSTTAASTPRAPAFWFPGVSAPAGARDGLAVGSGEAAFSRRVKGTRP